MDDGVFGIPLYQMAGRDVMSDDDDLFEREMASMGLGPDAKAVSSREESLFEEAMAASEAPAQTPQEERLEAPGRTTPRPSETDDEASKIFAEAMGALWEQESLDESAQGSSPAPDPPQTAPRPALERSPGESDTEAGRIFEEAVRELSSAPTKEVDRPVAPVVRDPWSEPTEVIKRLVRKGRLTHDSELDLHGMTQREARSTVESYLSNSRQSGARMVRVICGRGLHSRDGSVLLRDTLPTWLRVDFQEHVDRAFRAPREQGGEGAWYVILRRS